jgi:hypothetical protein
LSEQVYVDVFGEQVVLTDTVRAVILAKHPEVGDFIDHVATILRTPDEIRRSVRDERVVLYYRYEVEILGGKWLVVVIKRIDRNFISTIDAQTGLKRAMCYGQIDPDILRQRGGCPLSIGR